MKTIGVLSLQGDFQAHCDVVKKVGAIPVPVRTKRDLEGIDGLILPGGESTTMTKLLLSFDLIEPIREMHAKGKGLLGTCAGSILLAENLVESSQFRFGFIPMTVRRNGYGRQIQSFETDLDIPIFSTSFHAVFIRAPKILKCDTGVRILGEYEGNPVFVHYNNLLATTFHPEITEDTRIHDYFLKNCVST